MKSENNQSNEANATSQTQQETHILNDEAVRCTESAKQWLWSSVDLSARTVILGARAAQAAANQGSNYAGRLMTPFWLSKRSVTEVEDSLGVNQQDDIKSNSSCHEELSTPDLSPRSPKYFLSE